MPRIKKTNQPSQNTCAEAMSFGGFCVVAAAAAPYSPTWAPGSRRPLLWPQKLPQKHAGFSVRYGISTRASDRLCQGQRGAQGLV